MKRSGWWVLLTLVLFPTRRGAGQGAPNTAPSTDIQVRSVSATGLSPSGHMCIGNRNTVRVEVATQGLDKPDERVPIRLVLLLPGGDPIGQLIAEGSVSFGAGVSTATFTFLNVDVPERLRGRDGVFEARANVEGAVAERNLSNNVRGIRVDPATDWTCRR
jgi:hypothetical protein